MSAQFDRMSAIEMKRRIARKEMSPVDVTKRALEAAQATQKTLNCYSTLMPEAALAAAQVGGRRHHEEAAAWAAARRCPFR